MQKINKKTIMQQISKQQQNMQACWINSANYLKQIEKCKVVN